MTIKVRIPAPLRRSTGGVSEVELVASEVASLIQQLEERFPGVSKRLRDEKGNLYRFVNIFVNGEDVRFLDDLATKVKDGDEVSIVPAVAGG